MKIIKFSFISFFALIAILFILYVIDMTKVNNKVINKNLIEIDVKNLNSKYSYKLRDTIKNYYFYYYKRFFPQSYNQRWSEESFQERSKLPLLKMVYAKEENFTKQLYQLDDYSISNDWFRSHGNYFSTRFSKLDKINLTNISNLKLKWIYKSKSLPGSSNFNNIQANSIFNNGVIYTPDTENKIIALNAKNGKKIWEFKVEEGLAARRGLILWEDNQKNLSRIYFTNNKNKIFALNKENGELVKNFGKNGIVKIGISPIPPVIYKNELIAIDTQGLIYAYDVISGKIKWKYSVNKTDNSFIFENFKKGSPWGGMSLDNKRGILFYTTGNPAPDHLGIERAGKNFYSNSLVAFDLNNKKILWYFQEIGHDLWNLDFSAPPILTMVKKNNKFVDVVVGVSKLGKTYVFDRLTGESLFDIKYERAPVSNIPGEKTSPYQINSELPEKICRTSFNKKDLTSYAKNSPQIKKIVENYSPGFPVPPQLGKNNIIMGNCVRWAGASVDTDKNILYVTSDQIIDVVKVFPHDKKKNSFTYVKSKFVDENNFPAIKPPWGQITAINLNSGEIIWQIPFGNFPNIKQFGLKNTGDYNRSGLTATKGDLIFASGTSDKKIRAFNSNNGQEVWNSDLPSPGSSPPTIYEVNGEQHVLISTYENGGNTIHSYALKLK